MCFAVQTKGIHVEDKNVENVILQRNMVCCPGFGPKQASICKKIAQIDIFGEGHNSKNSQIIEDA